MSTVRHSDTLDDATPLSMAVIDAIARREGIDPIELDTPIYEVVDLDALDALTTDVGDTSIEVSFTYEGHEVTVDDEREIRITSSDE